MPATTEESRRQIRLAGQNVDYRLRRSARRSIGLTIDRQGLRVSAPWRAPLRDVERLLHTHARWVLDKLADWAERPAPATFTPENGVRLPFLGGALTLALHPARRASWRIADGTLHLHLVNPEAAPQLLKTALGETARELFRQRLAFFAPQLGVPSPPLRLSSARTRWGSCSARGSIALNWRLIMLPPALIDYVVCHELAHLREMNHGPDFWAIVERLCPDWRALRAELRQMGRELPNF